MIIGTGDFNINFKNSYTIYENIIKCRIKERDFNLSLNKSLRLNPNSLDGILKTDFVATTFEPYFTTIGLYNNNKELIAICKTQQAIPLTINSDMVIEVRYDT
jgi:hypothetical protein